MSGVAARLKYPNYEVVIVDDGSRDRTAEIAMEFPEFRLIRQPNKGLERGAQRRDALRRAARLSPTRTRTAWSIRTG